MSAPRSARARQRPAPKLPRCRPGREATPLAAGLHVVATPIGNLGDITLRALETLAAADLIACEDTSRDAQAVRALRTNGTPDALPRPQRRAARPRILQRLAAGQTVALVSDAGTPFVSDPGYKLVRAAQAAPATRSLRSRAHPPFWRRLPLPACRPIGSFSEGFCRPNRRRGTNASRSSQCCRRPPCCSRRGRVSLTRWRTWRDGSVARGRHLPGAHQAARGGAARRSSPNSPTLGS